MPIFLLNSGIFLNFLKTQTRAGKFVLKLFVNLQSSSDNWFLVVLVVQPLILRNTMQLVPNV